MTYSSRIIELRRCALYALATAWVSVGIDANAQRSSVDQSFEVATIKPVAIGAYNPKHAGIHVNPGGASYWYMPVVRLVAHAYGIESTQVTGPEWVTTDRFDIEAKFTQGGEKKDEQAMLQALLAERFNLSIHKEEKEVEAYVLIVDKHGNKLRPSVPYSKVALPPGYSQVAEEPVKPVRTRNPDGSLTIDMGEKGSETLSFDREKWIQHFVLSKLTMAALAARLGICLGNGIQRVVDKTELRGTYQVTYDCPVPNPPTSTSDGALSTDSPGSYLLTQSLSALGLRLEKRKLLTDVIVIDHVEKPSEN